MSPKNTRTKSEIEGIAVGVTLLAAAALCVYAPAFFDADGWQETGWHVAGLTLALIGVAGVATEVGRLRGTEIGVGDFGAGIACLVVATVVAVAVEGWDDPPSYATGALRWVVAFFVLFGVYGLVLSAANLIKRMHEQRATGERSGGVAAAWLGVAAALVGLTTAAVNLYGAIQATPSSGA